MISSECDFAFELYRTTATKDKVMVIGVFLLEYRQVVTRLQATHLNGESLFI